MTFEIFVQSDEKTWHDQKKIDKDKYKDILSTPSKSNPRDLWHLRYWLQYWEPRFMTIFVTWELIVTLDSIRNSCDVFSKRSGMLASLICIRQLDNGQWHSCSPCKEHWLPCQQRIAKKEFLKPTSVQPHISVFIWKPYNIFLECLLQILVGINWWKLLKQVK